MVGLVSRWGFALVAALVILSLIGCAEMVGVVFICVGTCGVASLCRCAVLRLSRSGVSLNTLGSDVPGEMEPGLCTGWVTLGSNVVLDLEDMRVVEAEPGCMQSLILGNCSAWLNILAMSLSAL